MAAINEFFNAISYDKENIFTDNEFIADYPQFIINRIFSYFPDTVFIANEMNIRVGISNKNHFMFMMEFVSKRRRKQIYSRKDKNKDLILVSECYNVSIEKAYDYLKILSSDQIKYIEMVSDVGGRS